MSANFFYGKAKNFTTQIPPLVNTGLFGPTPRGNKPCNQPGNIKENQEILGENQENWRKRNLEGKPRKLEKKTRKLGLEHRILTDCIELIRDRERTRNRIWAMTWKCIEARTAMVH